MKNPLPKENSLQVTLLSILLSCFSEIITANPGSTTCKDCLHLTHDRYQAIGLLSNDVVETIEGQKGPVQESQLVALMQKKGTIPTLHIIRDSTPSLLVSCLAIPKLALRYQSLLESLQKPSPEPTRSKDLAEFDELVFSKIPYHFERANQYGWETAEKSCQSRTLTLCINTPGDSKVCPVSSYLPHFRVTQGEDAKNLMINSEAFISYYKKIGALAYAEYHEHRLTLERTDGFRHLVSSDAGDCVEYGEGVLAQTCFSGTKLAAKYPKLVALTEFVDSNCAPLVEPQTMCNDTAEGFFREAHAYLSLDTKSPVASKVKAQLEDFSQLIPELRITNWSNSRKWEETERPKQACKSEVKSDRSPLAFLGDYSIAGKDQRKLSLFAKGTRCEGVLAYDYKQWPTAKSGATEGDKTAGYIPVPIDIYIAPEHCQFNSGKISFSFLDSRGFDQKSFSKTEKTQVVFTGDLTKTELRGVFQDGKTRAKFDTLWTADTPAADKLRRDYLQQFLKSMRQEACQ